MSTKQPLSEECKNRVEKVRLFLKDKGCGSASLMSGNKNTLMFEFYYDYVNNRVYIEEILDEYISEFDNFTDLHGLELYPNHPRMIF